MYPITLNIVSSLGHCKKNLSETSYVELHLQVTEDEYKAKGSPINKGAIDIIAKICNWWIEQVSMDWNFETSMEYGVKSSFLR